MPSRKILFLLIIIVASGTISLHHWQKQRTTTTDNNTENQNQQIEFFVNQVSSQHFRKNGSLHYQFSSRSLQYFKARDITKLSDPAMIIYSKSGTPWHISADSATVLANRNIRLHKNVLLEQKEQLLQVHTQELLINPQKEYAETDHLVMIDSPAGQTQGTGMKLKLTQQKLKLLSGVRSTYANHSP